ncbi:hypothetical protein PENSPDRAFT_685655 [Peniophora sp. CONT]|nr:hypothetical protein PENSPDRAFT_685655 [Peniophora sp. CONT]
MSLFSLTSLSSESDLSDGFTIVIPTITPSKKPSPKTPSSKPPPSPNAKSLVRRQSRDIVSTRRRARSSSRERETVTTAYTTTRSTLSSFTASSYPSRRRHRSREREPSERTWSYSYDSDDASSEEESEDDDVDGYSRPGGSLHHIHGRTDVLPALPLEPYSAFLAAYRLIHLSTPTRPLSPSSLASTTPAPQQPTLPTHLLPTLTPPEKRARRLALLLDSSDPEVQDWSLLELSKLNRPGRDLVRFGVFEVPVRPCSPVSTVDDEPVSDFDDASVSEVGGGMNWPWNRPAKRTKEEIDRRGQALEDLAARLENAREAAEEKEELDRERAWAQETFGRWLRDGRADGVFKEAAGVLDGLLRGMAREEGEEWALTSEEPGTPQPPNVEVTAAPETEDGSLEEVARVGTVVTDEIAASGTETERETAIHAHPVTTPFDAPVSTALALATPLVLPTSTPQLEHLLTEAHPKLPSPPIALHPSSQSQPPQAQDPVQQQDTTEFASAIISATRPAFKYMNSAGLPVPPTPPTYITPAAPAPKPPTPPPPPPTAISRSPPRGLPAPRPPPPPPPPPKPDFLTQPSPPKAPKPDSPHTASHRSNVSSTFHPPSKPKSFLASTSSPAPPADDEDKYSSYSAFYARDPRRAPSTRDTGVRPHLTLDDRPIRPHPAYEALRLGGPQPTPEEVYGSYGYGEIWKGKGGSVVGGGSVVSRRSAKSSKSVRREKDGKGKGGERSDRERERAKEKKKEREREREREEDRERQKEKEREREREREERKREEDREREREKQRSKNRRKDTDARSHVSRRSPSPVSARRKRDSSPRRRDSSPRRRDSSLRRRNSSPRRRDPSPRRRDPSPRRRDSSPRRRDREAPTTSRKRSSSRSRRRSSPPPRRPTTPTDDLEDIAVSSRISLETGRLTSPGASERSASPVSGVERRPRRRSSAGLTTPPRSVAPRSPSPSPPPPPKSKNKKSGKAQRLRGGAGSPSPPRPSRRFAPPPPPSEVTAEPLIDAFEGEAEGGGDVDGDGETAFPPLPPLPPIQFWMPPPLPTSSSSDSDTEISGSSNHNKKVPPVFLALGARRACVPYTPAFQGLDTRVVRGVSARERLALRDACSVLVRLGARVEGEGGMWSLSYVRF